MKRELLSRSSSIATRQRVYRVADGLEIDEVDHYEVRRSRVLYEDVVLVTFHRYHGFWFFIIVGLIALPFGWMSWGFGRTDALIGLISFAITTAPLVIILLLRATLGVDEINIYSRRSQARMRFFLRKRRAHALLIEITSEVRRRQEAIARSTAVA